MLLNDVTSYRFRNIFVFASDIDSFKHGFCKTLNFLGLAADGFEIMYFYVKVHFQKNFISENKVHCVFNRTRTICSHPEYDRDYLRRHVILVHPGNLL